MEKSHCSPKENRTCNVCDVRLELLESTQIWRDKFVYVSSTIHKLTRSDFDGCFEMSIHPIFRCSSMLRLGGVRLGVGCMWCVTVIVGVVGWDVCGV